MWFLPDLSPITWLLLVTFLSLLVLYGIWPYQTFKKLGIPGPKPVPFLGTFLGYRQGVLNFDQMCFEKYGKIWGIFDGRQPIMAILDPALIKTILVKECYSTFTNRRVFGLSGRLESAVSMAVDDQWKRIRTVLSPTFTSGKLKEMFPIIESYGEKLVKNIEKKVANKELLDMKNIFGAYSMDVVASTSFSVDIDSMSKPNDPFVTNIRKFLKFSFLNPLLMFIVLFPFMIPVLEKMNVTLLSNEVMDFFDVVFMKMKKEREKGCHMNRVDFLQLMIDSQSSQDGSKSAGEKDSYKCKLLDSENNGSAKAKPSSSASIKEAHFKEITDFLNEDQAVLGFTKAANLDSGLLATHQCQTTECVARGCQTMSTGQVLYQVLALTDEEILAQALIFVFAGYETTSSTLSYISYHLAIHPDVQKRLQDEIDANLPKKAALTYNAVMQMEYLDMVVNESLRLYPAGGRIDRVCKKTVEFNGVTIPEGMVVMIPIYALHHDPAYWPKPEEFRPERFSKENRENIDPYTYLPFGAGPRNCIGMRFALLVVKVAVVALLQNFSFRPCKDTPIPLVLDTKGFMQPKKPIVLKMVPRAHGDQQN